MEIITAASSLRTRPSNSDLPYALTQKPSSSWKDKARRALSLRPVQRTDEMRWLLEAGSHCESVICAIRFKGEVAPKSESHKLWTWSTSAFELPVRKGGRFARYRYFFRQYFTRLYFPLVLRSSFFVFRRSTTRVMQR